MEESEIKLIKTQGELPEITYDDCIMILNNNRERIRTLSNLVLTIGGLLFSSSFVILFFSLDKETSQYPEVFLWIIFGGLGLLLLSMIFSVTAALIPSPTIFTSKLELIDIYTRIYHREFRFIRRSVYMLLFSILLFIIALSLMFFNLQ